MVLSRLLLAAAIFCVTTCLVVESKCPHALQGASSLPDGHPVLYSSQSLVEGHAEALKDLDIDAVKKDIIAMLTNSQDFWPADYGNYGPFFVRQAWHCAGSYRTSDGRGGCDGARQRFEPERSWDDNTNLDKAKTLLWPIKQKYGVGLSWGDLIILAGTTAIESMGGPVLGFCAGRVDDADGTWSLELGPSPQQEFFAPCPVNGQCKLPLGSSTVGLIYVNPEGPMGVPNPIESAGQVRDTFGRMSMNDSETVALIGGGHAFGKAHGACPNGAGPSPKEDPANPWPGMCGSGKGPDTFTSGFEGAWSTQPTVWTNNYFTELLNNDWSVHIGPGGHNQWNGSNTKNIMMLTTDISLLNDPMNSYQQLVKLYAQNITELNNAFSHAWYKLTTRDMGPVTRCSGKYVPPAQPFQFPLPDTPDTLADFNQVKDAILFAMSTSNKDILPPDLTPGGDPYYGGVFVQLAYQCASTFRVTDYLGGCNGARIRFSPQKDWPVNVALDKALQLLDSVKKQFGSGLSWADLIVLAGSVALEQATGLEVPFCAGRTDATDGVKHLQPNGNGNYSLSIDYYREKMTLVGLTAREDTALAARLRSDLQMQRVGFSGSWSDVPNVLSNAYFQTLLSETWDANAAASGKLQYKARGKSIYMTPEDLLLRWDPEFLAISQEFASNNTAFLSAFVPAWTKLMNADRFASSTTNLCAPASAPQALSSTAGTVVIVAAITAGATAVLASLLTYFAVMFCCNAKREKESLLLGKAYAQYS